MAIHLSTPLEKLVGIGTKTIQDFKHMGLFCVRDLLWHIPFRYDDYSKTKPINQLRHGDQVTIIGTIKSISSRKSKNQRISLTEAFLENETGTLKLVWFNQVYLERRLVPGSKWSFAGTIDRRFKETILLNPIHEHIGLSSQKTGRIFPIYSLSGNLKMFRIREAIEQCRSAIFEWQDWLPEVIQKKEELCAFAQAVFFLHFPKNQQEIYEGRKRLAFDELLLRQLMFAQVRKQQQKKNSVYIPVVKEQLQAFTLQLPFVLTSSQRKAAWEIIQDLAKDEPMNRLLQGDVGSGKTVVAALAASSVLAQGLQVVYLAPTELLAKQQHKVFCDFFTEYTPALFTRSSHKVGGEDVSKHDLLTKIENNEIKCVIGTHALLQESVKFSRLALVIIDEQHRFGVEQRHALLERHNQEMVPHLLSMTATPIPRSLALSCYGDLEISCIKELPKGRKSILTKCLLPNQEESLYKCILEEIKKDHRAYIVCPLIEGEEDETKSVIATMKFLKNGPLKQVRMGILHGRLRSEEKEQVMNDFLKGNIQVLVSTTVIEVGVDVPEATVMAIFGAEHFGLAQLHQLRGRIGRSDKPSFCFLCPKQWSPRIKDRLEMLVVSQDGFFLAEKDLAFRGAGDIFGTVQSGFTQFCFADPFNQVQIEKARFWADWIFEQDSSLTSFPLIKQELLQAFDAIHLE